MSEKAGTPKDKTSHKSKKPESVRKVGDGSSKTKENLLLAAQMAKKPSPSIRREDKPPTLSFKAVSKGLESQSLSIPGVVPVLPASSFPMDRILEAMESQNQRMSLFMTTVEKALQPSTAAPS